MMTKNDLTKHHSSLLIVFLTLSLLIPLCYSIYTNEIWEDSLITLRYSKNLVDGNGLVYNLGKRVHGFTSPLGMLLLALCYLITNKANYFYIFLVYRIICISVFASACALLLSIFLKKRENILIPIWLGALFIFDVKSIAYTINGMETVFMLFFLAVYLYIISNNLADNWISAGICWGGLMWTRPDGIVYIMATSLANIIFNKIPRKENFIIHIKMSVVCAVLYLPWFIFAWSYYGSPIPNTVLAKLHYPSIPLLDKIELILGGIFGPIYYNYQQSWPQWIGKFSPSAAVFALFYWALPLKDSFTKIISFSSLLVASYFLSMKLPYPWYFPPLTMMCSVVLVKGLFGLLHKRSKILTWIIVLMTCFAMIHIFILSSIQRRVQQQEIEEANRKQIGLWFKNIVQRNERIYLEPIGYIGYFSEAEIIDYPGLVSSEVVQLMNKDRNLNFYTLIFKIKPEWVVLRSFETEVLFDSDVFKKNYAAVRVFDIHHNLEKYKKIAGIESLLFDASFTIFRKRDFR